MVRTTKLRCNWAGLVLAALTLSGGWAQAATPAELLEKAIYTEDSVGDLEEAIKLYQQVIAQAETAQKAAAQAQYRLGMIYKKQGKTDQAIATLEQLIKQYPNERELIAKARDQLPHTLQLRGTPWDAGGDVLQMNMKLMTGVDVGTYIYAVEPAEHNGQPAWRCWTHTLVTLNGALGASQVLCDRESFAPISSHWKHSLLGTAEASYEADKVVIRQVTNDSTQTIELDGPVFDNEQAAQLFRRLPLAVGYETTLPLVSTLGGGRIDIGLKVTSQETIEVPAGNFDCYRLELNIGQTFWIADNEPRHLVRFQAGGVNAELVKIYTAVSTDPKDIDTAEFTVQLPANWYTYAPTSPEDSAEKTMFLLDPAAIGFAEVSVSPTADLPPEQRQSPAAAMQDDLARFEKTLQDFRVVGDGIEAFQVGGHPATRLVATFSDQGKASSLYEIAVQGPQHRVTFHALTRADKFADYRKALDEIVSSLRLK